MKESLKWKLNTSHQGKYEEFKRLFALYGYALEGTHDDLDEIHAEPVLVIAHKASQVGEYVLVEDTSLFVEGEDVGVNVRWLLDHLPQLAGIKAIWKTHLAYRQGEHVYIYEGVVRGCIVPSRGQGGFGFDAVFMPEGSGQTLAEDKSDQVNARFLAVEALMNNKIYQVVPMINEWYGPWQ